MQNRAKEEDGQILCGGFVSRLLEEGDFLTTG